MQPCSRCGAPLASACLDVANSHATPGQASYRWVQSPQRCPAGQERTYVRAYVSTPAEVTCRHVGRMAEMETTEGKQSDGEEGATAVLRGAAGLVPALRCQRSAQELRLIGGD